MPFVRPKILLTKITEKDYNVEFLLTEGEIGNRCCTSKLVQHQL